MNFIEQQVNQKLNTLNEEKEETKLPWWKRPFAWIKSKINKRGQKVINKYTNEPDIKYRGPLSYRMLRIIAWACLCVGQLAAISSIYGRVIDGAFLTDNTTSLVHSISTLATSLFLTANIGLVFNSKRSFKSALIVYIALYLVMALALVILYYHYIDGILKALEDDPGELETARAIVAQFFSTKTQVNIFADLLAAASFHFFINYEPIKYFQGKNKKYFRLMALIPVAYVAMSFTIKCCVTYGDLFVPFGVFPFLATKSIAIHIIFIMISLWVKRREHFFLKHGKTKKDYQKFLLTNRNSLSFSSHISILFLIFSLVEWVIIIIIIGVGTENAWMFVASLPGFGQSALLMFIIPFVMLFSYTRTHKNKTIDLFVPAAGIIAMVFMYFESMYQLLIQILSA